LCSRRRARGCEFFGLYETSRLPSQNEMVKELETNIGPTSQRPVVD
jgi:hypothetical protein